MRNNIKIKLGEREKEKGKKERQRNMWGGKEVRNKTRKRRDIQTKEKQKETKKEEWQKERDIKDKIATYNGRSM